MLSLRYRVEEVIMARSHALDQSGAPECSVTSRRGGCSFKSIPAEYIGDTVDWQLAQWTLVLGTGHFLDRGPRSHFEE